VRVAIVINPKSGARGRRGDEAEARVALARRMLEAKGIDADVAVTAHAGHGAALAAGFLSKGAERIVAWGGDGTVNEVAGPLVGSAAALGIVPSGSGDGLARGLGLPHDPEAALAIALSGRARPMDVGYLGARHFLNVAGIGFDAAVAAAFNEAGRRGALNYLARSFTLVWSYRAPAYQLDFDGQTQRGARFVVAFANAPQYGNGLVLDSQADPHDGWLNAVVCDAGPALVQLWRVRRLAFRCDAPAAGVYRARVRRARLTSDELICHVDGEHFRASGTVEVRLMEGGIKIVGPRSA
jgi:diacylglycerol kinase family enzyme